MSRRASAASAAPVLSIEVWPAASAPGRAASPFTAGAALTAATVSEFVPEPTQLERAAAALEKLGFRVVTTSRLSLSVEGTPELFQRTFGTDLETRAVKDQPGTAAKSAEAFWAPAPEEPWVPPTELQGLVERAYIQQPFLYFESPLPPQVDYHHLRVPGDLAFLLNATHVHRQGTTGRGVRVAMIDSGFFIQHPYYQRHGYNMSRVLAPDASDIEHDANGHGTAEAANVLAVAPDVTFIGVKVGPNLTAAFKEAVVHAPHIITVSLGWDLRGSDGLPLAALPSFLKPLEAEIADAVAAGIAVIFSAGNGHIGFPGMHPDVISAGGTFIDHHMDMQASNYASAFKSLIYAGRAVPDVTGLVGMQPHATYIMLPLEPGCQIDQQMSADDGTKPKDGWCVISGTSAAAPQLAGVCALLKEKNPGLTPAELKAVLKRTARDVTTGKANENSNPVTVANQVKLVPIKATTGPDGATGHGLVDAFAAWMQV